MARLAILLVVAGALVTVRLVTEGSSSNGSGGSGKVGDCFTAAPNDTTTLHKVSCSSPKAAMRVIALAPNGFIYTPDCPAATDTFLEDKDDFLGKVACAVNLRPPHPGAPGAGGGVIRQGDCISVSGLVSEVQEVPCARRAPGDPTVLARVDSPSSCPPATATTLTLQDVTHPVLCLDRQPPSDQFTP